LKKINYLLFSSCPQEKSKEISRNAEGEKERVITREEVDDDHQW
jgi:hypothetical protein